MQQRSLQRIGQRRNKLLRYQAVIDEFEKHDCKQIPITTIWKLHIYPKFFISRNTLYRILNCPIDEQMQQLQRQDWPSLFSDHHFF
jgi:hypothetical protein